MSNWYIDNIKKTSQLHDMTRHAQDNTTKLMNSWFIYYNLLISWISNNDAFADTITKTSVGQPESNIKNLQKKMNRKKKY